MKHFTKLKSVLLTAIIALAWHGTSAQDLYISEVMFSPGGNDIDLGLGREFIEIMGTPGATIPANTYLVCVEGDGLSSSDAPTSGNVKMYFDLSGKTIGSNGYFAFVQGLSGLTSASDATVETAPSDNTTAGGLGWSQLTEYVGSGSSGLKEIESGSISFILAQTSTALTTDLTSNPIDVDSDDDGTIDIAGWTILDGVSYLDADYAAEANTGAGSAGTHEFGYGKIIFSQAPIASAVKYPASSTLVQLGTTSSYGYLARIGRSTGNTANDWMCVSVNSTPNSGSFKFSSSNISNTDYASATLTTIGAPNFTLTYASGAFTASDDKGGTEPTKASYALEFNDDYTSTADMTCNNLTIASGKTVTIAEGHTLTVSGNILSNGTLIIESGASLITTDGSTLGNVTIKRTTSYADGKYSFVGTPIESKAGVNGSTLGTYVYSYNETTGYDSDAGLSRWADALSTQLVPGKGYTQAFQQNISFTGVPNDGTITMSGLTKTTTGTANAADQGWHLLSNPYPAAIDADLFLGGNTGLVQTIYIWDHHATSSRGTNSSYMAYNKLGATASGPNSSKSFTGKIGSMQGFFVQVSANNTDVSFTESMRVSGDNTSTSFFRNAETESIIKVKLALEAPESGLYNEIIVGLAHDATIGKDNQYDAIKFGGNKNFQFYSLLDATKYAIQGLPKTTDVSTDLGFDLEQAQSLKLSIAEMSALEAGMSFVLLDKTTGIEYDLAIDKNIIIEAAAGSNQNRFSLTYKATKTTSVLANEIAKATPLFIVNNHALLVSFSSNTNVADFTIYNLLGKVIDEGSQVSVNENVLNIPLKAKGINVVKINTPEGSITRKFIF
jgi:hypothetical protein